MKIFITADWHIGKKLHNEDLAEDILLFFHWLLNKIEEQSIDYLLVAGDIFDHHNPSNEATKMYYSFLRQLNQVKCKAIIIAGNHDSPSFIDVPKELLNVFDIQVVGIFPGIDKVEQIFIPLIDKQGEQVAVVAAIPFLQDRFIRQVGEGEGAKEIGEKIKLGMKAIFSSIGEKMQDQYPSIPKIAIAHLSAQGTTISEAEREIQIGNQEGIPSEDLNCFDYLGLGHIHTGQTVIPGKVQYASSPISLGFTENTYNHKVIQLEIIENAIQESFIPIPKNRSLYQVSGNMTEVEQKVKSLQNKHSLQALLDIKIEEPIFEASVSDRLETLNNELAAENRIKIINTRILFADKSSQRISATYDPEELNNLNPIKVMEDLLSSRPDEEEKKILLERFSAIYADINQK